MGGYKIMTDVNILNGFKQGFEKVRDEVQEKINEINQEIDKIEKEIDRENEIAKQ